MITPGAPRKVNAGIKKVKAEPNSSVRRELFFPPSPTSNYTTMVIPEAPRKLNAGVKKVKPESRYAIRRKLFGPS
jgi:hypothetical protein